MLKENNALSSGEKKILDFIMGDSLSEGLSDIALDQIIARAKSVAKKGLLSAALLSSLIVGLTANAPDATEKAVIKAKVERELSSSVSKADTSAQAAYNGFSADAASTKAAPTNAASDNGLPAGYERGPQLDGTYLADRAAYFNAIMSAGRDFQSTFAKVEQLVQGASNEQEANSAMYAIESLFQVLNSTDRYGEDVDKAEAEQMVDSLYNQTKQMDTFKSVWNESKQHDKVKMIFEVRRMQKLAGLLK
jgi:hypothetical protein